MTGAGDPQTELRTILKQLEAVIVDLRELLGTLPAPEETADHQSNADEDPDIATELRSTIASVLVEALEPALRDLRTASSYRPQRKGGR
jgi:hypothetical protein